MNSLDYILGKIKDAVSSIDAQSTEKLIDSILEAKTIFIYGSGRSGLVGQFFAVRLVQLGLDVHFVGDMTTPIIGKNDLTVIISRTGETMSAVQTANIARRVGSVVISVTSYRSSKLAHASSMIVEVPFGNDAEASEHAPLGTLFEESVNVFLDSVVPVLMKRLNTNEQSMRKRHAIWV
jgi:6-phospho-3-hexuloisomerase